MPDIGIVGAGISGLHLALRLQQHGVATTLYAERTPEQLASGRPSNLVARFEHTRARERELGVSHWNQPEYGWFGARVSAIGAASLDFFGRADPPAECVDFRLYLPRLMADYTDRGGAIDYLAPDAETVARLSARHDLVVVASGGRSVAELFPRDPARSPYTTPQRVLTVGFYHGVAPMPERGMHYQLCPGVADIFCPRFLHLDGLVHGINVEAVPGGPLEYLAGLSYADDPAGVRRELLAAFAEHAPPLRERIDEREFDLARPTDLLQGGITPTVRTGWAALPDNKFAMAVGDAWVINDPIAGQGANLGSQCAFVLADAIVAGAPYDDDFCRRTEKEMWEVARPVTEWTNAFLQPPPPHAVEILAAANEDARVADAFINNFNDPATMWSALGSPEGAAAWLRSVRQQ
jgi:2-polyprenyl-6-methoxyphenol hydroxylase-like FAD-dependent oxidoreductase